MTSEVAVGLHELNFAIPASEPCWRLHVDDSGSKINAMPVDTPTFRFTIEGAADQGGLVSPQEFGTFLLQISKCLKAVAPLVGTFRARHVISELQIGSAAAGLSPVGGRRAVQAGAKQYKFVEKTLKQLERGKEVDPRLGYAELEQFKKLGHPLRHGAQSVNIGNVKLTDKFLTRIDDLMGGATRSIGTVKGRMEKFDIHNKLEFTLYPSIPGFSIRCVFPQTLMVEAQSALTKNVLISGETHYIGENAFPQKVIVQSIEVLPTDDELPTLMDIRNSMPNLVGGIPVRDFLESLRYG